MERWAANTLRTVGIILISGFVLLTCALLLLMSMCAYGGGLEGGGGNPQEGAMYIAVAVVVLIGGIWGVAVLARGIARASAAELATPTGAMAVQSGAAQSSSAHPGATLPLHLSPAGRKSVENLVLAMGAHIVIGIASLLLNQRMFFQNPIALPGHSWALILISAFAFNQIPYVILIIALLKKPDRRAFTYSIAVPAILVMQTMFGSSLLGYFFIRHPAGLALLALPFIMDIVILVLAYKAIQVVGLHPEPSSLIVAGVVTFVYFSFFHGITPFLYRFVR